MIDKPADLRGVFFHFSWGFSFWTHPHIRFVGETDALLQPAAAAPSTGKWLGHKGRIERLGWLWAVGGRRFVTGHLPESRSTVWRGRRWSAGRHCWPATSVNKRNAPHIQKCALNSTIRTRLLGTACVCVLLGNWKTKERHTKNRWKWAHTLLY